MLTRTEIQKRADYFGRLLELHLSLYSPEQTAQQLGVSTEDVLKDYSALTGYLVTANPDEKQRVLHDDLRLSDRFRGKI